MFRVAYTVVNVEDLEARFDKGEITPELLIEKGMVSKKRDLIKILGKGELKKAFTISCHAFSSTAVEKIKQAGGSVRVVT